MVTPIFYGIKLDFYDIIFFRNQIHCFHFLPNFPYMLHNEDIFGNISLQK